LQVIDQNHGLSRRVVKVMPSARCGRHSELCKNGYLVSTRRYL